MNIKLLSDKILVEVDGSESKTSSGVIVARQESSDNAKTGVVVAVGTGRDLERGHIDMVVKVGNKVMFQYGVKVMVEGRSYTLISESGDVLMVLS